MACLITIGQWNQAEFHSLKNNQNNSTASHVFVNVYLAFHFKYPVTHPEAEVTGEDCDVRVKRLLRGRLQRYL